MKRSIFFALILFFVLIISYLKAQPPCATNPVAADYCANAVPICNLNGYCGNTSSTYSNTVSSTNSSNETNTPLGAVFCATIQNNSWLKFIADSTVAIFNVWCSNCQNNHGIQMQIYATTDCYNFTAVSNCWNPMVPTNGQITATGLVPGNVYFFMIDGTQGDVCDYVIATSIGVGTSPTLTASQSICMGSSATMTATGGTTFVWASTPVDPGLASQSTHASITVSPSVTTTYTVTVTYPGLNTFCPNNNNILSSTVTVNSVTANITSVVHATCGQCNGFAIATGIGGTGTYTYSWSTLPVQTTATASNLGPGTYTVTVTSGNCHDTKSITVNNIPAPVATIPNITNTTCTQANGGATVSVTGGTTPYTYLWSTTPAQTTANLQNVMAGIYSVTVTDATNCLSIQTITVTDAPGPQAQITGIVDANCGQTGGALSLTVNSGTPPLSYLWNSTPAQTTANAANLHTGTYGVTVTDANGCVSSDTATIGAINPPVLAFSFTIEHCDEEDGSATVSSTGGSGIYTYLWNNGLITKTISGLQAGVYSVTVDDGYCTSHEAVSVPGTPKPTADFTIYPKIISIDNGPVLFEDKSSGNIVSWKWFLGDGNTKTEATFYYKYQAVGMYNVKLVVTSNLGCTDTASDVITVRDIFTFYIPNSFSPNFDGKNELFTPYGMNVDPDNFEMSIFDRWGNLAFHTIKWYGTHAEGWDGTKNNTGLPTDRIGDVFVYKIILKDITGLTHLYKGKIMLLY